MECDPPGLSAAKEHDPLNEVVALGMYKVLSLPGITATVRRWRYRGQPRVEFTLVGVPTDHAGAQMRDRLLRLRARVLHEFVSRGMQLFNTERNHDDVRPYMTVIDRLK